MISLTYFIPERIEYPFDINADFTCYFTGYRTQLRQQLSFSRFKRDLHIYVYLFRKKIQDNENLENSS